MEFESTSLKEENQTLEQSIEELQTAQPTQVLPRKTVRFWEFLGLMLLFAIPVVGFISCIIFLFVSKRKTLKNYAGATLTLIGVKLLTVILIVSLLLPTLNSAVLPTLNKQFGTEFQNINEMLDIAGGVVNENYSKIIKTLRPQLIETFGEEYAPLIEELSKKEYNETFKQVINEDYDTLLKDAKDGKYQNLEKALSEEEFNALIIELEAASKGEKSELFDTIQEMIPSFK